MTTELDNTDSIVCGKVKSKYFYHFAKRIFDLFCAIIGILMMLPVTLIIKISYMVSGDFKPIFYRQKRIGKNGKIIKIYKFRSMVYNADEVLKELIKKEPYKSQWRKYHKLEDDPRITKIGKIIRKLSLDELPQFINVLTGDMSLIGPRPLVEGELDEHNGNHKLYESVRPGITGWWASNGRSAVDYDKRLELEYYYIKNCSIMLDIKCIFRTIKAVVFREGAK